MEYRIAIVNSSSFGKKFPIHLEKLQQMGKVKYFMFDQNIDGEELARQLKGYNIIISSVTPFFSKKFFDHKDELLLISRHGIGFNNIDIDAAHDKGVMVTIIPALVERDAVAENNVTNLLAVMRKTVPATRSVRKDKWETRADFLGHSPFNKTVGIIGVGNTGSCVAEILRGGYRCDVLGYDPYKSKLYLESKGVKKVSLEDLLTRSDMICICANLTSENYHMISKKEVDLMKPDVYISNTARGALLDENAIVYGLKNGKIAGFAADVLEVEPGDSSHPYLQFDNVIITPHTSAYTVECLKKMGDKCVADCFAIKDGKLPERIV